MPSKFRSPITRNVRFHQVSSQAPPSPPNQGGTKLSKYCKTIIQPFAFFYCYQFLQRALEFLPTFIESHSVFPYYFLQYEEVFLSSLFAVATTSFFMDLPSVYVKSKLLLKASFIKK